MSILMGPYEEEKREALERKEDKDLMVFGYHCKLYRDDVKAELESSGSLLIPWMGDSSLMVDRYDIRNHFDDKGQFGIKPNLPHHMSQEEEQFEELLDNERYKSLGNDVSEQELEEEKRTQTNTTYTAIGFNYNEETEQVCGPEQVEHPPTQSVDIVEDEKDIYYDPPNLTTIPFYIERPFSKKFQSIIERTALFISQQGQQMEIIIKTKQKFNPNFSFLHHDDRLFPYYKQLLHAIISRSYVPSPPATVEEEKKEERENRKEERRNSTEETEKSKEERRNSKEEREYRKEKGNSKERRNRKESSNSEEREKNHSNSKTDKVKDFQSDSEDDEQEVDLHPLLRTTTLLTSKKTKETTIPLTSSISNTLHQSSTHINSAPDLTTNKKEKEGPSTDDTNTSTDSSVVYPNYDLMSAYYKASQRYEVIPPPPDLQPIVDRTADYVAKNGSDFERTVILKHIEDRRFEFLHPWNEFHNYYKSRVNAKIKEIEDSKPFSTQRLTPDGNVSFKLTNNTLRLPIGLVDLNCGSEGEEEGRKRTRFDQIDDHQLIKRQKLSGGQIDSEFKKFLSTVKTILK